MSAGAISRKSTTDEVSIAAFTMEVTTFLQQWPERPERSSSIEWGAGGDDVSIFEEVDPEAQRAHLDEVRAWRKQLAAAGLAWITGPPQYGGRGLRYEHQVAFDALARTRA